MTRPHSEWIDVGSLAAQQSQLEREYSLDRFERLADRLARPEGLARVDLRYIEAGELPGLEGHLQATPWLVCQRCLEAYPATVESTVRVAFADSDEDAARAGDEYEVVETESGRFELCAFVEDELLLALPLVPMHETAAECAAAREVLTKADEGAIQRPAIRPFGDLRALMKR